MSVGVGMAHPSLSFADEVEAIRATRLAQNAAMAAGDVALATSFWTDDVTVRRGLGASSIGKDAYQALLDPSPNATSLIYERIPDEIVVSASWPLAYESGTWSAMRGCGNNTASFAGRYAAHWVKRDGRWLIRSEVFVALDCFEESCPQALP